MRDAYTPVSNTRCRSDLSQAAWSCCSLIDSVVVVWLIYASQRVFVKFHVASEEFREKTGLGSFSRRDGVAAGAATWWPATPCLVWEWMLRMLNIMSQLGVPSGVVYSHPSAEQMRGRGGAMVQARLLGFTSLEISSTKPMIYLGTSPFKRRHFMLSEINETINSQSERCPSPSRLTESQ